MVEAASTVLAEEAGDITEEPSTASVSSSSIGAHVPALMSLLSELIDATTIDGSSGNVMCALPPWNTLELVARMTTWLSHVAMAKRSVSIRCVCHSKCSVAKARSKVTDHTLLKWLYAGHPPLSLTSDDKRKFGELHVAMWKHFLQQ